MNIYPISFNLFLFGALFQEEQASQTSRISVFQKPLLTSDSRSLITTVPEESSPTAIVYTKATDSALASNNTSRSSLGWLVFTYGI